MATILSVTDFTSRDIAKQIELDARYLQLGDDYFAELLQGYGLTASQVPATPAPKVKRLLVAFVASMVCRDRVSLTHREALEGAEEDPWEKLYRIYRTDLSDALSGMSRDILLGNPIAPDGPVSRMYRGGADLSDGRSISSGFC